MGKQIFVKVQELEQTVIKAQQDLRLAENKSAALQTRADTASAEARLAKAEFKRMRKSARKAKGLLVEAQDCVRDQRRLLARTQKRLAKAMTKLVMTEAIPLRKPEHPRRPLTRRQGTKARPSRVVAGVMRRATPKAPALKPKKAKAPALATASPLSAHASARPAVRPAI
jgi:hypothetical protein